MLRNTQNVPLYIGENHAETIATLENRRVLELLATDHATLALIRPVGEDGMHSELLEGSTQDTLEAAIQHLGFLFKFVFKFDELAIDTFYVDPPRGRFALRNHNNLLHDSDSPESALQEVGIIVACLKRANSDNGAVHA